MGGNEGHYDGYNHNCDNYYNEILTATRDQGYKTFGENVTLSQLYLQNNVFEPRDDNPFFKHTYFFERYLEILESHLVQT